MIAHQNNSRERSFLLSLGLTSVTFLFELIGGIWSGSLALISDSAHVFLDVFALGISYLAIRVAMRPANDTHSYGFHRLEVLAAFANGISLLFISIGIFYEAWQRWFTPTEIHAEGMLWIAVVGLVINLLVARVLHGHQHIHSHDGHGHDHAGEEGDHDHSQPGNRDLNVQSAYLHVLGDAISSVGVILAAIIIRYTDWNWLDPIMSVIIGIIIISGSYRVLRSSLHILVEGVPEGIRLDEVKAEIQKVDGISNIHDLHVWNICSGNIALSAHLLLDQEHAGKSDQIIRDVNMRLKDRYQINHTTIQTEFTPCTQPCCD